MIPEIVSPPDSYVTRCLVYADVEANALPTFKSLPEYSRVMAAGMLLEMGGVVGAECAVGATPRSSDAPREKLSTKADKVDRWPMRMFSL